MYRGKSIYSLKELFESGKLTKEEVLEIKKDLKI